MKRVFLVQWDVASAHERAKRLQDLGFKVEMECENGGRAYRTIRTSLPEAVILDLRTKPGHGREVGQALRELKALKHLPIVCIEDEEEGRERTRMSVPEVVFTTDDDLAPCLSEAITATRTAHASAKRASRSIDEE